MSILGGNGNLYCYNPRYFPTAPRFNRVNDKKKPLERNGRF